MCGVCGLVLEHLVGLFFFVEDTVTSIIYFNMFEGFASPQIEDMQREIIFQQDGAPPHWALVDRAILNEKSPGHWIG